MILQIIVRDPVVTLGNAGGLGLETTFHLISAVRFWVERSKTKAEVKYIWQPSVLFNLP